MSNLPRVMKFIVRISIYGVYFDSLPMTLRTAEKLESEIRSKVSGIVTVEDFKGE